MLAILRQQKLVPAVVAAVALLAAVNWVLSPEQASRWLRSLLALPLVWLVLTLWYYLMLRSRRRRNIADDPAVARYFYSALAISIGAWGVWQIVRLSLLIWVQFGDHAADVELERRVLAAATGVVLIFIGNALPKILTPFSMLPPDLAARQTKARRFIGSAWVMFGLTIVTLFIATPFALARMLLPWILAAAMLTMLGAIVWMNLGPARRDP